MAEEMIAAAVVKTLGEPPEVESIPAPEPVEGGEEVEVLLAGINPVDLAIASGKFDAGAPPLPYTAGREGIARTADGRVIWFDEVLFPTGSMAERAVLPAGHGVELPDGTAPEQAIGFGIAGTAAWLGLEWRGGLQEGETVLVLGASGAVGQVAVQAARLLGAGLVVGAARSESGRSRVAALGADAVVSTEEDDLTAALQDATGGGPDLILDCLWGEPAVAALRSLKPHGRLVQVGNSAAKTAEILAGTLRGGSYAILGHRNFWASREERARVFRLMCQHAAAGDLELETEVRPLAEVAELWRRQAESPGHKLALSIG